MNTSTVTADQVAHLVAVIGEVTGRLDPDAVADGEVKTMLGHLVRAQRLLDGAVTLLARRTVSPDADTKAQRQAAEALAEATGTTTAAARRQLATSAQLADQTAVADAVRYGELSAGQTEAIVDACAVDPDAQADLVDAAESQSLADLRQSCRDRRQQADPDREATRRRHHRRRSLRTWGESDGEWRAALSAPADVGARFEAALRADHDAVFTAAHAAGRREDDACYRLDALVNLMERGAASRPERATAESGRPTAGGDVTGRQSAGQPAGHSGMVPVWRSGRQATVIVNVDVAALRRGRVGPGERCRIAGVGEVSVAAVKAVIPDAHLAYVIRDTVDIRSVVHLGVRRPPISAPRCWRGAMSVRCRTVGRPICWRSIMSSIGRTAVGRSSGIWRGAVRPITTIRPAGATGWSARRVGDTGSARPASRSAVTRPAPIHQTVTHPTAIAQIAAHPTPPRPDRPNSSWPCDREAGSLPPARRRYPSATMELSPRRRTSTQV